MRRLDMAPKGALRDYGAPIRKLTVTPADLRDTHDQADLSDINKTVVWNTILIGRYCVLRKSEYVEYEDLISQK